MKNQPSINSILKVVVRKHGDRYKLYTIHGNIGIVMAAGDRLFRGGVMPKIKLEHDTIELADAARSELQEYLNDRHEYQRTHTNTGRRKRKVQEVREDAGGD